MVSLLPALAFPLSMLPSSTGDADEPAIPPEVSPEACDLVAERGPHLCPGRPRSLSKKEAWLAEKARRPDVHLGDADLRPPPPPRRAARKQPPTAVLTAPAPRPGSRIEPATTLYNVWTHEALPILPGEDLGAPFGRFLRDHFTNQSTRMDGRLLEVLVRVAKRFGAQRIDVVSGYRSPKYNLMLRKKGHQVARESQHVEGHAVDFRVPRVAIQAVLHFVRAMRLGGVGFYPHSQFVHADTGKIRYWTGS